MEEATLNLNHAGVTTGASWGFGWVRRAGCNDYFDWTEAERSTLRPRPLGDQLLSDG